MVESALGEFERLLGNEASPWFEYNLEMASGILDRIFLRGLARQHTCGRCAEVNLALM